MDPVEKSEEAAKPKRRQLVRQRTRDVIHKLGTESYMHGISKIMASNSSHRKTFWACLLLCGVIAAVTQLTILTLKYLKFNSYLITTEQENAEFEFPSITICPNQVPFQYPSEGFRNTKRKVYKDWENFLFKLDVSSVEYDHFSSWTGYYENLPDVLPLFTLECKDVIMQCTYHGEKCSCKNFEDYVDAEHIVKCYTFNASSINIGQNMKYAKSGPDFGLSLILGLDDTKFQYKYSFKRNSRPYDLNNLYGYSSGFTVQVHPPDTIPTPMTHGFDISTSQSTSVTLKGHLGKMQPYPYSNCSFEVLRSDKVYHRTLFTCDLICKQTKIAKLCGCSSSVLPPIDFGKYPICGKLINWQWKANITELTKKLVCEKNVIQNHTPCQCSPCEEVNYDTTISSSEWPKEDHVFMLLQGLSEQLNENLRKEYDVMRDEMSTNQKRANISLCIKRAKENLARLNVYFKDLNVMITEQVPSYELTNLMADIGGSLGLWIGISALSLMELFELLTLLLCAFREKNKNRGISELKNQDAGSNIY